MLNSKIVYKVVVENNIDTEKKFYIGLTENSCKERYSNHKKSFNNKKYQKETELSKYIWELKAQNKINSMKWSVIKKLIVKLRLITVNYV